MKKSPIALSTWRRKVQETQDAIRPNGFSLTAEALRDIIPGKLTKELAHSLQVIASTEAQMASVPGPVALLIGMRIGSLLDAMTHLDVVDYCGCWKGEARRMEDLGRDPEPPEPDSGGLCIACISGVKKKEIKLEVVH